MAKKITYTELKKIIQRVYSSQKRIKSRTKEIDFKHIVRDMFTKNNIDYTQGKGRKWYKSIATEFASRGGSKNAKQLKDAE